MLDHVLRDGFHQRVIGDGLHENPAVVVLGRRGNIHLQGEGGPFLLQAVVDVFDRFEPGHARVVDMVRLVVQHHQFVDVAHDHAQIHFGVGGRAAGPLAQKIVHRVFILGRCGNIVAGVDAVDVGQKDVAGGTGDAHLVLDVQGQLKIVAPVAPVHAVAGDDRIFKENAQPLKILIDAIQHDDVGGNHQKVARKLRLRLIQLVIIAPGQRQAQHLGLAGAGRHFDHKTPPGFVEHPRRNHAGTIKAHHVVLVLHTHHVVQVDDRLQRLPLRKVILKLGHRAIGPGLEVRGVEPPVEQAAAGVRTPGIAAVPPFLHLAAKLRRQGRHQLVHAGIAQGLIRRKPAERRVEDGVGRFGEVGMERHYFFPTATSTIVMVSLPKMSTTLTASLRRPGSHS